MQTQSSSETKLGVLYALAAFFAWGFLPLYWKALKHAPAMEILVHRMIWTLVFVVILISMKSRWQEFRQIFRSRRNFLTLVLTSVLISGNWLVYIWAVNANHIVETSLGYFINPLLNVFLGVLFLKERLNLFQSIAVGLAFFGVAMMTFNLGSLPWIALVLASSFGIYGLLRKTVQVEALVGLGLESAILTPVALIVASYFMYEGSAVFATDWSSSLLFIGTGVATALPLLWFAHGARRLRLSTIGIFQYIGPSIQLALGVFLYDEPFTKTHGFTFGCIWLGLIIYSVNSIIVHRKKEKKTTKNGKSEVT